MVMSCERMETRIVEYADGRLKESERAEVEKHLAGCAACRLRVNEFRSVNELLGELPQIEPSPAFDARVHARVAAQPQRKGWWAWLAPSPRVAFAASLLLLATVWIGTRSTVPVVPPSDETQIDQNLPALENYDVISDFGALSDLPQTGPADENQTNDAGQTQQPM